MKSVCEFDFLDMPNNFNLQVNNSNGFIKTNWSEDFSPQDEIKIFKIKNKISTTEKEKCPSSSLIIKILKNVKIGQEKVFVDLSNTGINFCHNQSILEKIKLTSTTGKNTESIEDAKIQIGEIKKNLMPGIKRKFTDIFNKDDAVLKSAENFYPANNSNSTQTYFPPNKKFKLSGGKQPTLVNYFKINEH